MRALIQRVSEASCESDGVLTGEIKKGLLVFLGIRQTDNQTDREYLITKLLNRKFFSEGDSKFSDSVVDAGGSVLLISQFTLYGSLRKGTKPEFSKAMQPEPAQLMFDDFTKELAQHIRVETGSFGNYMKISSVNEGPVSFMLSSDHLPHHG